jgi:hypothetical protein
VPGRIESFVAISLVTVSACDTSDPGSGSGIAEIDASGPPARDAAPVDGASPNLRDAGRGNSPIRAASLPSSCRRRRPRMRWRSGNRAS